MPFNIEYGKYINRTNTQLCVQGGVAERMLIYGIVLA